jgi:hypothetical protein
MALRSVDVARIQRAAATYATMARQRHLQGAVELARTGASGIDVWTDQDLLDFRAMAQRLNLRPADLLLVLFCESGLKPWAATPAKTKDGYPVAVGLNQITSILNSSLGLDEESRAALLDKPVSEQLPYVERSLRLFAGKYALPDAGALYTLNFAPARLAKGADGNVVLYDSKVDPGAYNSNRPADIGNKGFINIEDMRIALRRNANNPGFLAALGRYQAVTGDTAPVIIWPPPPPEQSAASVWPWVFSLGAAAAFVYGVVAWKRHYFPFAARGALGRHKEHAR